jgi:uncharacterized protein YukE
MVSTGQYDVTPEAVRSIVGNVGGIIMQTVNAVLELESMVVAPTSFATIGSAVASTNTALQAQQVASLRSLLTLLQQVNNLVKSSVDAYDSADQAVSAGYGGQQTGTTPTPSTGLWSTPAGAQVAGQAVSAGTGTSAQPDSVSNVVGYLTSAGVGTQTTGVPTSSPHDFVAWLDASPDNQAGLGVIGVYSGAARGFGDVPGGVHDGDMVIIDPGSGATGTGAGTVLGVIGNSGQLYNNGLVQPEFGAVASLRVYRPM